MPLLQVMLKQHWQVRGRGRGGGRGKGKEVHKVVQETINQ